MALQATLPPTDSQELRRTALMRRLAAAQSRTRTAPARRKQGWARDLANVLGFSPPVMMVLFALLGASLGFMTYGTLRAISTDAPPAPASPASLASGADSVPSADLYVNVSELSRPAQAIDDYYFFLRQGMFDEAWVLTDQEFRSANYPGGLESYREAWSAGQPIEVLSLDLLQQDDREARFVGVVQEGGSDLRWRNTYVVQFDPETSSWKIHAIVGAW